MQSVYVFNKRSQEHSLASSPDFSNLQAFEFNTTSDWLIHKV